LTVDSGLNYQLSAVALIS